LCHGMSSGLWRLQKNWNKKYELGQWTFCGRHIQKCNKFSIKALKSKW